MAVTKTHPIKSTLKAVRSTNGRAARRTAPVSYTHLRAHET